MLIARQVVFFSLAYRLTLGLLEHVMISALLIFKVMKFRPRSCRFCAAVRRMSYVFVPRVVESC